jgi:predicted dehydrogenase
MAIHTFDQARLIMGRDPVSVFCHEFNPPGSWYRGNAAAVCIFEFADGQLFTYEGAWCAEGAPTSWEASWRVLGSQGTALWDGSTAPYAEVVDRAESGFQRFANRVQPRLAWSGQEGHFGCLDAMFEALASGRRPETDSTDNVKSMAMVFGAIESSERGEKVQLHW